VGRVGVRKGVPELLEAWESAGIDGELVLAGPVDDEIADMVERHCRSGSVRTLGFVKDPSSVYLSSHVFVFPTLEEGGPQVTYEAAGCGLPVITTPMGAARLIETGRNGIVVDPSDVNQLAAALRRLAYEPEVRAEYAAAAEADAQEFAYPLVGARRAEKLRWLFVAD
jgi:glycosyltransferase involved in cell wall biosynthesis